MNAQVIDMNEHRLTRIAEEIHAHIAQAKGAWKEIGVRLIEARSIIQGDREFGRWVKAQGFGLSRSARLGYRCAAEFAAHHDVQQIPADWNVLYRASTLSKDKQAEALDHWKKGELLGRVAFNKHFRSIGKDRGQAEAVKSSEKAKAVQAEVTVTMTEKQKETFKQKLSRAVDTEVKALRAQGRAELNKMLAEALAPERAKLAEAEARAAEREREAIASKKKYGELIADITTIMTHDEFKVVRACLHPDRTEIDKGRLSQAFAIFNRMEKLADKTVPIAMLRARGWEDISPHYRPRSKT